MDIKLSLGHVNCRSLLLHFNNFEEHVRNRKYSLIAVSETWLNDQIHDDAVELYGYRIVRKDRDGRGGGVAMYVKDNIRYEVFNVETVTFEILALSFKLNGLKFMAAIIYRPPGFTNMDSFFSEFDETVAMLHLTCDRLILTGDFNINMLKVDNSYVKCFVDILESYSLV
nr:unnamed protein product [Callosobruchus analis]